MPTIPVPSHVTYGDRPRDDEASRRSIALRIKVAFTRQALARDLAAGAPTALSPELRLRAAQLVKGRHRRQAAGAWRRTIKDAHEPPMTRAYFSLIRQSTVVDAEDSINAPIGRLNSDRPVSAQRMAMLDLLLTNGTSSPLYTPADAGALRHET